MINNSFSGNNSFYDQILNDFKMEYVLQKPTRNEKGNTKR